MTIISMRKNILYFFQAQITYAFLFMFSLLPINLTSYLGGIIGRAVGPLSKAHKIAQNNLIIAFPEMSPREHKKILTDSWDNFGRVMTEYAHLKKLSQEQEKDRIQIEGLENLQYLSANKEPFIIFFGHLGNWEINGLSSMLTNKTSSIVYRPPNNHFIAQKLLQIRNLDQETLIPKGNEGAIKAIKRIKENGILLMAIDQKMNNGLPINFFGKEAMTGDAIARIALRYKCPILPLRSQRLNGCNFKLTFEQPWLYDTYKKDNPENILLKINKTLERWIKDEPNQWLWFHNRWPKINI